MRLKPLFVLSLALFAGLTGTADARTVSVTGSLASRTDFGNQLTLTLPPGLHRLTVRVPLPTRIDGFAFTQAPGPVSVTASRTPAAEKTETDGSGNPYRILTFENPAPGLLSIRTLAPELRVNVDLDRPLPESRLPLADVPSDVAPYLQPSPMVQSGAEPFVLLARDLQLGARDEATVADNITAWLARNITYGSTRAGTEREDALGTITSRRARCEGWAHAFLALARASGIPARFVAGYSLAGSVTYPASGDGLQTLTFSGASEPHAWVEVWYPGAGWVPYDPQSSSGFVDTHHVRTTIGLDAVSQEPLLSWASKAGSDHPSYVETPLGGSPVDVNTTRFSYARSEPRGGELISRAAASPPASAMDVAASSQYPGW